MFLSLVSSNRGLYQNCPKYTKLIVAKTIVQAVRQQKPPGRFIKLSADNCGGVWKQITYDQAVAKTSQALTEKDKGPLVDTPMHNSTAETLKKTLNHMNVWRTINLANEGQQWIQAEMQPVIHPLGATTEATSPSWYSSPPLYSSTVREQISLHHHDVILARGKFSHSGNEWYQKLINEYRATQEHSKLFIAEVLVKAVYQQLPRGRFLRLSLPSKQWTLVSNEEAIEKTLHSLYDLSQQASPTQCNKSIIHDDNNDNDRYATDKNVPLHKKRRVHEGATTSNETKLLNLYSQDEHPSLSQSDSTTSQDDKGGCEKTTGNTEHPEGLNQDKEKNFKYAGLSSTFKNRLKQLVDYKQKNNGNANVPGRFKGYGNLGRWVVYQRSQYKAYQQNKQSFLTENHVKALEDLDFKWGSTQFTFDERLSQLADYKQTNGNTNVPECFRGYGNLGRWVAYQRGNLKLYQQNKPSSMTKERAQALAKLDFVWENKNITFDERLSQLAGYRQMNGNTIVPQRFRGYGNLGRWVADQRGKLNIYQQNKPSSMTKGRAQALAKLDFVWGNKNITFDERLSQLVDYRQQNGDTNVPCKSKEYDNLGRWASNQRNQYKLYQQNKPSGMTNERVKVLEDLDFEWRCDTSSLRVPVMPSLPVQKENAAIILPPAVNTIVEEQIEYDYNDDEQQNDDNNTNHNYDYGSNESAVLTGVKGDNDNNHNNEDNNNKGDDDDDDADWREMGSEYYNIDDDCLLF